MTTIILEKIKSLDDLALLSEAYRKGKIQVNISKLSRELNKDRKTIKKYLNGYTPKETKKREKYLDVYRNYIVEVLTAEYQSFDYIDHLFKYLKREKGITCSRSTLNRYIRTDKELNNLFKHKKKSSFTERFETNPGEQAQFDMKEDMILVKENGEKIKINIPTLTLSWSRHNSRKLILNKDTDILLAYLAECFEELNGVPRTLVIDNLKQFVAKPRTKTSAAILTEKFAQFCKDYGITPIVCKPYRPETKGKVETQNKIVDQLKNYNGKYKDIYEMHKKLEVINKEDNEDISQATLFPRKFLLAQEKDDLLPLPNRKIREKYHLSLNEVFVTSDALISYKSRKYSVPKEYIGLKVSLTVSNNKLHIYYNKKIITVHALSNKMINKKEEHELYYENIKDNNDNNANENALLIEMRNIKYD